MGRDSEKGGRWEAGTALLARGTKAWAGVKVGRGVTGQIWGDCRGTAEGLLRDWSRMWERRLEGHP